MARVLQVLPNAIDRFTWLRSNLGRFLARGQLIVFAGTRSSCDLLARRLLPSKSVVIHGDKTQAWARPPDSGGSYLSHPVVVAQAERMDSLQQIKKNLVQVGPGMVSPSGQAGDAHHRHRSSSQPTSLLAVSTSLTWRRLSILSWRAMSIRTCIELDVLAVKGRYRAGSRALSVRCQDFETSLAGRMRLGHHIGVERHGDEDVAGAPIDSAEHRGGRAEGTAGRLGYRCTLVVGDDANRLWDF